MQVLRFFPSGYHHYLVADLDVSPAEWTAGVTRKFRIRNPQALNAQRDRDVTVRRVPGMGKAEQYECTCHGVNPCPHVKVVLAVLGGPRTQQNPCISGPSDRSLA